MTERPHWSQLCYPADQITAALRELELAVVSLDHLGSAGRRLDLKEDAELLRAFVENWQMGQRLGRVRHILSSPLLEGKESSEFYDYLEQAMADVPTWSWENQDLPAKHRIAPPKTEMSQD
jgi:hypothetical protein